MRKAKKLLILSLAILFILSISLFLTGCNLAPFEIDTWYLSSYIDEEGNIHYVGYDHITTTHLYSDDITIRYFENNTFVFKKFDKEYTGTYKYKKGDGKTSISLAFSDGTKGKGTCARYGFDGTWYEGTLQVFGKEYFFGEHWREQSGRSHKSYNDVGENISEMLKKGKSTADFSSSGYLYKGEVERRGEEFWFVPSNQYKIEELNLSQAYEIYTYEFAGSVERGDNALRECECFISRDSYTDERSSKNFATRHRYAIWYYEEVFKEIYPWTVDLEMEDILSVRIDAQQTSSFLPYYQVQIFDRYSREILLFSSSFLSQEVILGAPLETIANQYTFYIETADQSYTVVLQKGYTEEEKVFVVNGQFYRIYTNTERLGLYNALMYYAFKDVSESGKLFIGDEYVKSYDNVLENILFVTNWDYKDGSSEHVLIVGENTLILSDEKQFIWVSPDLGSLPCRIVGDVDFTQILKEYPRVLQ